MNANFMQRHQGLKDLIGMVVFIACVIIGTLFINSFIFRTFSVVGPSSWPTLVTGDRLIVDRIPVTVSQLQNKPYVPKRGQFIVFKNPSHDGSGSANTTGGEADEYIVKRVIAFGGERVKLVDGSYTVYNKQHPNGFDPDKYNNGEPGHPASGEIKDPITVPNNTLFVSGDHREGSYSFDSRNGLGYIPYYEVIGPVSLRIWPINTARSFSNEGTDI